MLLPPYFRIIFSFRFPFPLYATFHSGTCFVSPSLLVSLCLSFSHSLPPFLTSYAFRHLFCISLSVSASLSLSLSPFLSSIHPLSRARFHPLLLFLVTVDFLFPRYKSHLQTPTFILTRMSIRPSVRSSVRPSVMVIIANRNRHM